MSRIISLYFISQTRSHIWIDSFNDCEGDIRFHVIFIANTYRKVSNIRRTLIGNKIVDTQM